MTKKHLQTFANDRFLGNLEALPPHEQKVVKHLNEGLPISHNTNIEFESDLTLGQRLADKVASFGGSWIFITIFAVTLVTWVLLNSVILARFNKAFDPYPYILLNLFLSMLASIQAPLILMSQRRQSLKDRLEAEHDYEVNLKAEFEILDLHEKIDELRENQWAELISMQQEQIRLLSQLIREKETGSKNYQDL